MARAKQTRFCVCCRKIKPATAFATTRNRKCEDCHRLVQPHFCHRCREYRPPSEFVRGGRVCVGCRATPTPEQIARALRPCIRCGGIKAPTEFAWSDGSQGKVNKWPIRRRVCLACEALEFEEKEQRAIARRATWEQDGRMVRRCSKCREIKDLEQGFLVDRHLPDGSVRRRYMCAVCDRRRIEEYRVRERDRDPAAVRADWARRKRAWNARNRERARETQRNYKKRVAADPVRYAAFLESLRISYRLRREKQGASLDTLRAHRLRVPTLQEPLRRLPAAPLAETLESIIAREGEYARERICEAAGIAPRNLFGWTSGERKRVQFDVADRVLTRLGLNWWDVWDEDQREVFEGNNWSPRTIEEYKARRRERRAA